MSGDPSWNLTFQVMGLPVHAELAPYVLTDALLPGQHADLTYRVIERPHVVRLHTHADFCEVLWVSEGCLRHYINGCDLKLHAGDVVMVRVADHHQLEAVDDAGGVLHNIAFDPQWLDGTLVPEDACSLMVPGTKPHHCHSHVDLPINSCWRYSR